MTTSPAPAKSWLGLWIALSTIWGFSFFFIKIAGTFLDPFQQTFARMFFGALTLVVIVGLSGRRFIVRGPAIKHLALLSLVAQSIPFTVFALAEHHITSIAAGLLNSTMTLWTALFALVMLPEEKLSTFRATGLGIGFFGLMILLGVWDADFHADWVAYIACALCTMGYAFSGLWTRKHISPMGLDPISAVATQLTFGAVFCAGVAAFSKHQITSWPANGVLSIMALGVLGTGAALVLNFLLVQRAGAVATSTVTYAIPVVATLAGALILHEKLHWYEPIGAALVLTGIAIVQQLIKPRNKVS
jgi:drug/metabolite transporter (DMT)-like permease